MRMFEDFIKSSKSTHLTLAVLGTLIFHEVKGSFAQSGEMIKTSMLTHPDGFLNKYPDSKIISSPLFENDIRSSQGVRALAGSLKNEQLSYVGKDSESFAKSIKGLPISQEDELLEQTTKYLTSKSHPDLILQNIDNLCQKILGSTSKNLDGAMSLNYNVKRTWLTKLINVFSKISDDETRSKLFGNNNVISLLASEYHFIINKPDHKLALQTSVAGMIFIEKEIDHLQPILSFFNEEKQKLFRHKYFVYEVESLSAFGSQKLNKKFYELFSLLPSLKKEKGLEVKKDLIEKLLMKKDLPKLDKFLTYNEAREQYETLAQILDYLIHYNDEIKAEDFENIPENKLYELLKLISDEHENFQSQVYNDKYLTTYKNKIDEVTKTLNEQQKDSSIFKISKELLVHLEYLKYSNNEMKQLENLLDARVSGLARGQSKNSRMSRKLL
ncbi:hypothetical protein BY996DRAFT_6411448 [Phakopsora pachyrhizi]|uniref:Expressed protein n=1 Tax=Phakopsora pachyrhizi TaxID=170000 RepID=A0AAV0AEA4_PHAPC|nr:hypothetical protein BY996DRAFT_6411448 [Phakopsora pachyrhizi]CAH7665843.1 expressed protein [Phakopsora pachyrhizi]